MLVEGPRLSVVACRGPSTNIAGHQMKKRNPNGAFSAPKSLHVALTDESDDDGLGGLINETNEGWYGAKHPKPTAREIAFVNSIKIGRCPYCGSALIAKDGHRKDGVAKLRCRCCGKGFNPLTGTVLDSRKIPISEWVEYLVHLSQFLSTMVSSIDNHNASTTGVYWLRKAFAALENYQKSIVMGDVFWLDETYLSVKPSEAARKEDGTLPKGLSKNKLCIVTATDGESAVIVWKGYGKPSRKRIWEAMEGHIKPGSKMIDDGEKSHAVLVERLGLKRESHPTPETKGLPDSRNPLKKVNDLHALFKLFMRSHGGYSRDDAQCWCDLFAFAVNHHGDRRSFVKDMILLAISTRKVMRYRETMKKNPKNG